MKAPGNADVPVGRDNDDGSGYREVESAEVSRKIADGDLGDPKIADEDVGAPRGAPRGWYSRGYLPHFDAAHFIQSVTYRLADSLPQSKLAELREELDHLPDRLREIEQRKRIEGWLDAGMGCCALAHPAVARYVQDSFLHFHGERYHLHAWCIMPNHVHVLIEPVTDLATIVQGWKSYTARWVLRKNEELALNIPTQDQFWMREYWDRYIRDAEHYRKTVEYIHYNPVKAGLCNAVEDWLWLSARLMQVDGSGSAPGSVPGSADVPVGRNRDDGGGCGERADEDVGAPSRAPSDDKADGDVGAPREVPRNDNRSIT